MVEATPTIDISKIEKANNHLRAVAKSATALFFALTLSACLEEVNDVKRLSDKYTPQETTNTVSYLNCQDQPNLEITPRGDEPFYSETVVIPGDRTATFLLPTLDRETIAKVRVDGQINEYSPENGSAHELFDGDLIFIVNSNENRVLTSVTLELDCTSF